MTVNAKRELFAAGDFTVTLQPLNAFKAGATWTNVFMDGWGDDIMRTFEMTGTKKKS